MDFCHDESLVLSSGVKQLFFWFTILLSRWNDVTLLGAKQENHVEGEKPADKRLVLAACWKVSWEPSGSQTRMKSSMSSTVFHWNRPYLLFRRGKTLPNWLDLWWCLCLSGLSTWWIVVTWSLQNELIAGPLMILDSINEGPSQNGF